MMMLDLRQHLPPIKDCLSLSICLSAFVNLSESHAKYILAGLEWHDCFVYIDDILVVFQTFEEHIQHLEQVFDRLRPICHKVSFFIVTLDMLFQ